VGLESLNGSVRVRASDIVSDRNPLRHDPDKLAQALLDLADAVGPEQRSWLSQSETVLPRGPAPGEPAVAAFTAVKE
jgi:hypothetical protein